MSLLLLHGVPQVAEAVGDGSEEKLVGMATAVTVGIDLLRLGARAAGAAERQLAFALRR